MVLGNSVMLYKKQMLIYILYNNSREIAMGCIKKFRVLTGIFRFFGGYETIIA